MEFTVALLGNLSSSYTSDLEQEVRFELCYEINH